MQFCVYLTVYRGNKLPPFYIGSTSLLKIQKGYCGSVNSKKFVNVWRQQIKTNRSSFCVKIIKIFDTRRAAYEYEDKLHRQLNVIDNALYTNASFASNAFSAIMTDATKRKISIARAGKSNGPHTELTKAKMSASSKGKKKSLDHRRSLSIAFTGRVRSAEATLKTAIANTGKKRSQEARLNISKALKGKSRDDLEIGSPAYFKKLKSGLLYTIAGVGTSKYKTTNLKKFCDSIGAYQTSFARSLKSGKPLAHGQFKGWQVLEKRTIPIREFEELVLREMEFGFGMKLTEEE